MNDASELEALGDKIETIELSSRPPAVFLIDEEQAAIDAIRSRVEQDSGTFRWTDEARPWRIGWLRTRLARDSRSG